MVRFRGRIGPRLIVYFIILTALTVVAAIYAGPLATFLTVAFGYWWAFSIVMVLLELTSD